MTSTTQSTDFIAGFAMPSNQLSPTAARGTGLNGHVGVFAAFGEFATTGTGICADGTTGGRERLDSRFPLLPSLLQQTGNGSGAPADPGSALDRGKRMAEHAEATQRLYGASGECPRRISA